MPEFTDALRSIDLAQRAVSRLGEDHPARALLDAAYNAVVDVQHHGAVTSEPAHSALAAMLATVPLGPEGTEGTAG